MNRRCAFIWLVTACLLSSSAVVHAAISKVESARIDQILQESLEHYHLASITAEVRAGSRVIYARSLGYANLENDVPATPQALYAIGSITKSLTSFAIMRLVDQGKLHLNSTLGDVLPEYKGPARVVTILQLLTHTSGIPDYAGDSPLPPLWGDPSRQYTEQEVVDLFRSKPLVFKPGSRWQYSNSGYYMLSVVLERITGRPYGEAVNELVLQPFGLSQIVLGRLRPILKGRVNGYTIDAQGHLENALRCDSVLPLGAGAYIASADDLTRYIEDLFSDKVPKAVHQMMFHAISLADGTQINYLPSALAETDFHGHRRFDHGGGYFGFLSFFAYYPDDRLALAVLTNTDSLQSKAGNLPAGGVVSRISRVLLGIHDERIVDLPLSATQAQAYVGTYRTPALLSSGDTVQFVYSNGSLLMKLGSDRANWYAVAPSAAGKQADQPLQGATLLLNEGNGRFVEKINPESQVLFLKGSGTHLDVRIATWHVGHFVGRNAPIG
jgi:D-alanyl-D-alanine carboxypeptidase